MRIKINGNTITILTEVKASTNMQNILVREKDPESKVVNDKFVFGFNGGAPSVTKTCFIGNAVIDGKLAYTATASTEFEKEDVKRMFGPAVLEAAKYEEAAIAIIGEREAQAQADDAAINNMFDDVPVNLAVADAPVAE